MIHVFFLWKAFVLFPIWFSLFLYCYIRIILAVVHITYITNILCISVLSLFIISFSSVPLPSHVWLFAISWTAAHQASLSITNYQSLLKLMSIKSVMPSNHLILCHPLLLRLQSFPASGSFPMRPFLASGGQTIGASASVLPMNIQDWFPLELTSFTFLQSKGLSRVFSSTTVPKFQHQRPYLTTHVNIPVPSRNQ